MSINVLKKQIKYCFLKEEDEELNLLRQKRYKEKKIKIRKELDKTEQNLSYFETQDKYKKVSKNVMRHIKFNK